MNVKDSGIIEASANNSRVFNVAIVGGGAGGIFAARYLANKARLSCKITVYEQSARLGGEVETRQFAGVGHYEAGAAEVYSYSRIGPDPLHDLIVTELGLEVRPIQGGPCILDKIGRAHV